MMTTIATLGQEGSLDWEAARSFRPDAELVSFPNTSALIKAFAKSQADFAVIPAYNTRDGESKEFFRAMAMLEEGYWIDNLVLPIHLSLGTLDNETDIELIIGKNHLLKQC